ncbi:phosphoribosylglycinamide formyltransferase, partial [Candidatus Woesearchaeota archaeon CG11_big_fil_rev_8_21_14_0_20_43_8]
MQPKIKLAVFASGGGSNLQVIIDGCADETIDASVSVFVCNDPSAHSIQRAKNHGIPVIVLPNREFRTREKHEEAILKELDRFDFDFIALAGYMRIF